MFGLERNHHLIMALRTHSGSHGGQVIVEFALLMPVLLLLVLGIMEFGRAWMNANMVTQAAREGARAAIVLPDLMENDHRVAARVEEVLTGGNIVMENVMNTVPLEFAGPVVVSVTTEYSPVVTTFIPGLNGPFYIQRQATMRFEGI